MTAYVALLRAVNVGGTGRLPMATLVEACADCGFLAARTYTASGNVVFTSRGDEAAVAAALDGRLRPLLGPATGILVRTAAAMAGVLADDPFVGAPGNRTVAIFLDRPAPADALAQVRGRTDEELHRGGREIYVRYPSGIAASRLTIPAARHGTARNMNTVARLAAMAAALG